MNYKHKESERRKMTENCFFNFLLGTHPVKGNQLIRSLPQEIRHKIWLDYAVSTLSYSEVIEKEMIEVLEAKLDLSKSGPIQLPPRANFVIFEQSLVQELFVLSCQKMKLPVMNFFFRKYGKKVYPFSQNVDEFWRSFFKEITFPSDANESYFAVLGWLKDYDFKFDVCIYTFAILANNLSTLRWMVDNFPLIIPDEVILPSLFRTFPFDPKTAKFLLDTFPGLCHFVDQMTAHAINVDNIDALIFISSSYEGTKEYNFNWQNMMMTACYYSSFRCMDWINNTSKEFSDPISICDHRILQNAIFSKNNLVLTWLYINRREFRLEIDEYSRLLSGSSLFFS